MSAGYPVLVAMTGPTESDVVAALESEREVEVVHRCVDLAELLVQAGTGRAVLAIVSADLRGLDLTAVGRLRGDGLAVLGVTAQQHGSPVGEQLLTRLGIPQIDAAASPADLVDAIRAAVESHPSVASLDQHGWSHADPGVEAARYAGAEIDTDHVPATGGEGRLIAVWGPAGSPGRTTVAVNLAAELAEQGGCILADADTYAASISQHLGILDEAPGLAAACRAAAAGNLDLVGLARLAPLVGPRLRVLTGISRSDRWPELAGPALESVWTIARSLAPVTVVDTGFCLEQDEELSYDTFAPRRNASTLVTLAAADRIVVVGSGDPVGIQRLVRGVAGLADVVPGSRPLVVITKVRPSAIGAQPERQLREALQRYSGITDPVFLPDERDVLDAALLSGRSILEHAPHSRIREATRELAARVQPVSTR